MLNDQSMLGQIPGEQLPGVAQPAPEQPMMQAPPPDPMDQVGNYIDYALSDTNLARKLENKKNKDGQDTLTVMAAEIMQGYRDDEQSREKWLEANDEWIKMALLIRENKTYPWPKASNIKYPLIATAAMQFSARAYPALVPQDGKVVKARVVRKDKQGLWQEKAIRVAMHMSWQIMYRMPHWEEEMDKLLMTMAISGICFKETFHNALDKRHVSQLVYPEDLCINYHAKNLENAYRKTRILYFNRNEIQEKVNNDEMFLDIEYGSPVQHKESKEPIATPIEESQINAATPHKFLAVHTFWDLDDDGYEEPYIVTIHEATEKIVRIIARWDSNGVTQDDKGNIIRIKPVEYFTAFPFIPNADGSIYAIGFGMLLGPINEAINTNINQLTDAGTLANLSGGFVSKNLRIKMGQMTLTPGKWTTVNATGDDLKNGFYPIPVKEPSNVLMSLLQMLITSGNQLASIAEIMVGKMPGQNTPATTTQETVQQSMAVFTAIYKRVYRSLESEFKKIARLNRITPGIMEEENGMLDEPLQVSDYDSIDDWIVPGADPSGDTAATKTQKIQGVGQLLALQTIDPMKYTMRALEAMEVPNFEELIPEPQPPQPDPKQAESEAKAQEIQMKMQMDQQKTQAKIQGDQMKAQIQMMAAQQKLQLEQAKAQLEAEMQQAELEFEKQMQSMKMQGEQMKMQMNQVAMASKQRMDEKKMQYDVQATQIKGQQAVSQAHQQHQLAMATTAQLGQQKVQQSRMEGHQKLQQSRQEGQQRVQQQKQQQKMKPNANKQK